MHKLCSTLNVDNLPAKVVGFSGDEMEIRAGLTYVKHLAMLVGCETPIAEKNIDSVDPTTIPDKLATKIMMVHITTIDGKACVPFLHFPTKGIKPNVLYEKVHIKQTIANLIKWSDKQIAYLIKEPLTTSTLTMGLNRWMDREQRIHFFDAKSQ